MLCPKHVLPGLLDNIALIRGTGKLFYGCTVKCGPLFGRGLPYFEQNDSISPGESESWQGQPHSAPSSGRVSDLIVLWGVVAG